MPGKSLAETAAAPEEQKKNREFQCLLEEAKTNHALLLSISAMVSVVDSHGSLSFPDLAL